MRMTTEMKREIEKNNNEEVKDMGTIDNGVTFLNSCETSYEDGSYWVEYSIGTGNNYSIEGEEDEDKETLKLRLMGLGTEKLTNKIFLKNCSKKLQEIIGDCLSSDNDTWFIEEEEITQEELKNIEEEITKLGLDDCIVVYEEEITPVIIYGETITKFIY